MDWKTMKNIIILRKKNKKQQMELCLSTECQYIITFNSMLGNVLSLRILHYKNTGCFSTLPSVM